MVNALCNSGEKKTLKSNPVFGQVFSKPALKLVQNGRTHVPDLKNCLNTGPKLMNNWRKSCPLLRTVSNIQRILFKTMELHRDPEYHSEQTMRIEFNRGGPRGIYVVLFYFREFPVCTYMGF